VLILEKDQSLKYTLLQHDGSDSYSVLSKYQTTDSFHVHDVISHDNLQSELVLNLLKQRVVFI